MVGASKILTVSYGTFSCTLEGFDDPFSTMRSIAEYFRDLAADDRYFGAEPPTPDAEMLQRIAEKEVQRRVDARLQDNGLVLTQADEHAAPRTPAAEPHGAEEQYGDGDETRAFSAEPAFDGFEDDADPAVEDLPQASDIGALAPEPGTAETIAEKLNRIRAVVDHAREQEESAQDTSEDPAEDVATDVAAAIAESDEGFDSDATEADIASALAGFDTETDEAPEAVAEDEPTDHPVAEDETGQDADAQDEPLAADALTALSGTDEDVDGDADAWTDLAVEAAQEDIDDHDESDAAHAPDAHDFGQDVEPVAEDGFEDDLTFDDDATEEAIADDAPEAEAADSDAVTETADLATETEPGGDPIGRVVKISGGDFLADRHVSQDDTAEADAASESAEEADWAAFDGDDVVDELAVEELSRLDGASQDDLADAATSMDETESTEGPETHDEAHDDDLSEGIRAALAAGSQDDADETAEAAAPFDEAPQPDTEPDTEDALAAGALAARDRLGAIETAEEKATDVDRLLEKTNSQMQESEGSRRRSAIAHLKAAVAATKADRLLKRVKGPSKEEEDEQTQYRADLAQVVRPRRPDAGPSQSQSERPKPILDTESPLMLVSELRVDGAEDGAAQEAIRPRRVSHDDQAEAQADAESSSYEDGASFAEFAEKMGAKDLPDLLEAAAAYAAFVENRPHFSRPQIMKRVARHDQSGEFTREAGLRSFGQLLRQGKIRKLKRGQFTVADTTRFNPDARIAGE